jgi:hypothetical protein
MNPKLLKMLAKGTVAVVGSILIGSLIKAEKAAGTRIDEYFETQEDPEN